MSHERRHTQSPSRYVATVTRRISAAPQRLFDLIADPAMHPVLDGNTTVRAARDGNPERLGPDATFSMDMRLGAPYRTVSHVVEFDEASRIAWQVGGRGAIWRYTFEPDGDGTLVTEQWDVSAAPVRLLLVAADFPRRSRIAMLRTLARLAELTEPAATEPRSESSPGGPEPTA